MTTAFDTLNSLFILLLVLSIILVACFQTGIVVEAQTGHLPQEEVKALEEIAEQLHKKDWNFTLNPCDGNSNWNTSNDAGLHYSNSVLCNCSYPGDVCHIEQILLKAQDLDGVLPPALVKLPYVKNIDLAFNYLSGTIPPEWASTKLEYMSVAVNRLSGPIPKYLGNITTLTYISLENNMFNQSVPAELGKLLNLAYLTLSYNNLMGQLPPELNNLIQLKELKLSGNSFTGKLPSFRSWKQLEALEIQASGFEGPIPSSISVLSKLTELRISDLNGGGSKFPHLETMAGMKKLMLRSCNISGKISDSITRMPQLSRLDLSFNKLEGGIPKLDGLANLNSMYLTGNLLTGPIPEWVKLRNVIQQIDISYNNFSAEPPICTETPNLFRSFSGGGNNLEVGCLSTIPCPGKQYKLHINCGGSRVTVGKITFEADEESGGPANFFHQGAYWGVSSTGFFWDHDNSVDYYTVKNVSILREKDTELYTKARVSALSLTYFARCLENGNYTVTLRFAEIILRENQSFQSLGKRMFDIYVQDEGKYKDFDIEHEARGVDKAVIRTIKAVVKDKTLQIRFVYTGKGTANVPVKSTYGPLISAISVESDFKPPSSGKRRKIFIAVRVVASGLCLILMVLGVAWWKGYMGDRISREQALQGLDLQTGVFTFRQIKAATNNFDVANKIGEGGFGSVYKGVLLDGTVIAVKQLSSRSKQGTREFVNEIGMISSLQHPNLVRLHGCCAERKELLLVYEFMENNSLAQALFGPEESRLELDWPTRQRICIGIARGLVFLHEESILKIVHRDIKATNILLDTDLNPKISDFGLAKLDEEENTHISTRVAGTIGYMAPEYALWGYLTYKADVYSFGVVVLEIVAGKNNTKYRPNEDCVCLVDWALILQQSGNLMELVDPGILGSNYNKEEAMRMIKVAILCINPSPALRPTMSSVVKMLNGDISIQELKVNPSIYGDDFSQFQADRDKYYNTDITSSSQSETRVFRSGEVETNSSSTSAHDLYPPSLLSTSSYI